VATEVATAGAQPSGNLDSRSALSEAHSDFLCPRQKCSDAVSALPFTKPFADLADVGSYSSLARVCPAHRSGPSWAVV